ncbi:MAG TPA: hypothetical protein VKT77_09095 [Chthonomonadaceae bacterium]|nr:hypothetical protein [Chthonomonadaceae bacterium]
MSNRLAAPAVPAFTGLIGAARVDITPPAGIYFRNWGAATTDVADGVHRPLTATAISLRAEPDAAPLALVSLDLGWWRSRRDEEFVRHGILRALDLPASRLMLSFTHTHAGPVLCRGDADRPGGALIAPYLESLGDAVACAIHAATAGAILARLEWSCGRCGLAANRDLRDPDRPRFLSGYNPLGTADDTLLVGRATAVSGAPIATLVNYACHPTTLAWQNRLLSPDFIGALRDVVESGAGGLCAFLQGASGELAPREQYTGDTSVADRHGRALGFAALSALAAMPPPGTALAFQGAIESGAPLARWETEPSGASRALDARLIEVELPLQPMPTVAELDVQLAACRNRVLAERLVRKRRIREGVGDSQTTAMPLWAWRVGDALLVGHPNEAYSALQTELRSRFPGRAITVMNVVNGHFGYLPSAGLYGEDLYPVWQTPFGPGSLETLIEAAADAVRSLGCV